MKLDRKQKRMWVLFHCCDIHINRQHSDCHSRKLRCTTRNPMIDSAEISLTRVTPSLRRRKYQTCLIRTDACPEGLITLLKFQPSSSQARSFKPRPSQLVCLQLWVGLHRPDMPKTFFGGGVGGTVYSYQVKREKNLLFSFFSIWSFRSLFAHPVCTINNPNLS